MFTQTASLRLIYVNWQRELNEEKRREKRNLRVGVRPAVFCWCYMVLFLSISKQDDCIATKVGQTE